MPDPSLSPYIELGPDLRPIKWRGLYAGALSAAVRGPCCRPFGR